MPADTGGYKNFADFTARNNLKTDGSENVFLNQTEKLAAVIRVVPDAGNPNAGRLQTTLLHSGNGQVYELEERIRIGQDGTVQSDMSGTGQGMGVSDQRLYDDLVSEYASQKKNGYETPAGQAVKQSGYGMGGASSREGDYHKIVDSANRTYGSGSCLAISDVRAFCTTGLYLDKSSEYRLRIETFQQNAGQITRSSAEIGRQYESNSERNMVSEHQNDRPGIYHFTPK